MKVGIIGANGQLGQDLVQAFAGGGHEVVELNHDRVEITDAASIDAALDAQRLHQIVNTAAMLHVDNCEVEVERAFRVNAAGVRTLALACRTRRLPLLHFSTDYVFDGSKQTPYSEQDQPLPLQVYGVSKLAGEYFVRSASPQNTVVRVSGIYGHAPCRAKGANFVQTMLRLAKERDEVRVVDDEIVCPTPTADVARQVVLLVERDAYGLYHVSSHGQCSWYRFAQEIWRLAGLTTKLSVAKAGEFPGKAPRPKYSVLGNYALRTLGMDLMRPWEAGLKAYLG